MDTKDIDSTSDIEEDEPMTEKDMVEKMETSIDCMNYIKKVQKRIDKINSRLDNINRLFNNLKVEKKRLTYRLEKMEALQKLAIITFD